MENKNILEVKGLKKYFPKQKDIFGNVKLWLKAVDDVTFTLEAGKTIGVVGESGCGKTTLGRTILQLYDTTGGKSIYYGHTVDEILPKYYVNTLKNSVNYQKKYVDLKNKLANVSYDELSILNNVNDFITIKEYKKLLVIVDKLILDNEDDKSLINVKKNLEKIINVLEEVASVLGGLVLGDASKAKELYLQLLYKKNELNKKETNENNNLLNEISNIYQSLSDMKKPFVDNELFNELEALYETGLNLAKLSKEEMRKLRTEIQLIFQDPYSSLPPRMTIGAILTEPVVVHNIVPKDKVKEHVRKVMKMCGLQPQYYDRYPHEFSGGQRQRICIARALVVNPKLVICDEPVSALDVSIQAQIINLLKDLQKELGLTYMFISHDLSVVKYITDSIIVMYLGNMMEIGDTKDIFENPLHPYTKALFSAVPVPDPDAKMNRIILKGDIPSPVNPPKGCKFHTRCEKCMSVCKLKQPEFILHENGHMVACHLYNEEVMNNLSLYDKELEETIKNEEE